jgi:predicted XRE-type DNA-binding protein
MKDFESGMEITESSGNVFADLGFEKEEAENLQVRALLLSRLIEYVEGERLTQQEAAERLGVHQPRISVLMQGKIGEFSIDALVTMLARAGLHLKISFDDAA